MVSFKPSGWNCNPHLFSFLFSIPWIILSLDLAIISKLGGTSTNLSLWDSKAINFAIQNSLPNEVILVAGKGHETYQDYG